MCSGGFSYCSTQQTAVNKSLSWSCVFYHLAICKVLSLRYTENVLVKEVGWGFLSGLCNRLMCSAYKSDWRWSWFGMEGRKQDGAVFKAVLLRRPP